MIINVIGNIGSGKTLLLTTLAHMFYENGYYVFSNYHIDKKLIKNIEYIRTIEELNKLKNEPNKKKFFAVDEGQQDLDSRASLSKYNRFITKLFLQSRKYSCHIALTSQFFSAIDIRIRALSNFIIMPTKLYFDPFNQKPFMVRAVTTVIYQDIRYSNIPIFFPLITKDGRYICDFYDTLQFVDEFEDETTRMNSLVMKYIDSDIKKKDQMKSYIYFNELEKNNTLTKSDIDNIVNYIFYLREQQKTKNINTEDDINIIYEDEKEKKKNKKTSKNSNSSRRTRNKKSTKTIR